MRARGEGQPAPHDLRARQLSAIMRQPVNRRRLWMRSATNTPWNRAFSYPMSTNSLPRTIKRLSLPLQALGALGVGVLLGLAIFSTRLDSFGGPVERMTGWFLPLAGLSLLALISLRNPLHGLLLALLLGPYSSFIALDLDVGSGIPALSLARTMAALLVFWLLVQAVRGQRRIRRFTWSYLIYALFLLSLLFSTTRSLYDRSFVFQSILDAYILPFVMLYLAYQIVTDLRDLRFYSAALVLLGVSFAFLIVREQVTGEVLFNIREASSYSRSLQRVSSLMGNAAPMGVSTALALPLGIALLLQVFNGEGATTVRQMLARLLLPVALLFIALGVFLTYNRASWLGVVITVVVFALLRPRARRLLLPLLLVAAILAAIFWQNITASAAVNERLLNESSLDYRGTVARLALDMARENPIFGQGYYNFGPIAKERYGWDPSPVFGYYPPAHNTLMFVLVSGGLLALLPYVGWFAMTAWQGLRRYTATWSDEVRDVLAAGAALLLLYFSASITFDNVDAVSMNMIFATTIGAIMGATKTPRVGEDL